MKLILLLCLASSSIFADAIPIEILPPCPQGFETWVKWRTHLAREWSFQTNQNSDSIGEWAQAKLDRYRECRKESLPLFAREPGLDSCFKDLLEMLKATSHFRGPGSNPPRLLGMNVPDAKYYRKTSVFTAIPDDIRDNQAFLKAVSKLETMGEAYRELDKLNEARKKKKEPLIEYSRFVGNVTAKTSESKERLLLYIPGNPEKWISIALASQNGTRTPQISAIGVHTNGRKEKNIYFKDHWRLYKDAENRVEFEDVQEGKFSDACWKCHKSGLLTLPVSADLTAAEKEKVRHFNEVMLSQGVLNSGGYYDARKLGVGIGGDDQKEKNLKKLREEIFPFCVANTVSFGATGEYKKLLAEVDRTKVTEAMNCSQCHDGETRGLLTPPYGDIVFRSIREGKMPPGANLSDDERRVLKECLELEQFGVLSNLELAKLNSFMKSVEEGARPGLYRGIEGLSEKYIDGRQTRYLTRTECRAAAPESSPKSTPGH
jgi:hypothetical protein